MKNIFKLGLILIPVLLAGCIGVLVSAQVNEDVHMPKNPQKGLVAFSTQCIRKGHGSRKIELWVSLKDEPFSQMTRVKPVVVSCKNFKPEYFMLKLPVNTYEFSGIISPQNIQYVNVVSWDKKPHIFTVTPGKVNYVGRVLIELTNDYDASDKQYKDFVKSAVIDHSVDDIKEFKSRYTNLSSPDDYKVSIAKKIIR